MIEEYLEEYQQGVPLTENQQVHLKDSDTLPIVQLLVPYNRSFSQLKTSSEKLTKNHISLGSSYQTITGFKGIRALPSLTAKIVIDELIWPDNTEPSLAKLTFHKPCELAPKQGVNLHITKISTEQGDLISLRGYAVAVDSHSLKIIVGILNGQPEDEETLQFPDFVDWQLEMLKDTESYSGQAYWQNYLAEQLPEPLKLPYFIGTLNEGYDFSNEISSVIPTSTWSGLKTKVNELGVTQSLVAQYVWWWLLARLANNSRFLTALNYDPRNEDEAFEGAIGRYEKRLPLVVEYKAQQSLDAWLLSLHEQCKMHQQLAQYTTESQLEQVASNNESIMTISRLGAETQTSCDADLTMMISEDGKLRLSYSSNSYTSDAVKTLLGQFEHVLRNISLGGSTNTSDAIAILSPEHEHKLLSLNNLYHDELRETVVSKIEQFSQVQETQIALQDSTSSYNYKNLFIALERVASGLLSKNSTSKQPIVILLPRSNELVIAMLATMRIGSGFVPLDPNWPQARIDSVLSQFNGALVIDQEGTYGLSISELLTSSVTKLPVLDEIATSLAYTIFTSGSSGKPKGVMIGQQQLAAYCIASSKAMSLEEQNTFALTASVSADLGYTCLFNALYLGKRLVIANEVQSIDSASFSEFLKNYQIDCIKIVPSHLQALCDLKPLPYFPKKIILGGEACPSTFLRSLQQWSPTTKVYNHYGPSETTIGVMCHEHQNDDVLAKLSHVFEGTEVYVLNTKGDLCSYGEVGQLYIAGCQLSDGYFEQPQYVAFSIHEKLNKRIYATGDLARYMPDNTIMILGRSDDQVKVRGYRVELAEVANVIEQQGDIEHCLVIAEEVDKQLTLYAYIESRVYAEGPLDQDEALEIQQKLSEKLTDVMVPNAFIVVHQWPRLGNGKVDRRSLPKFQQQQMIYEPPQNDLEKRLANLFSEVLELPRVSRSQSFFQLGGHSISAIKVVKRWEDREPEELHFDLAGLFQSPSVEQLAIALNEQEKIELVPMNSHEESLRQMVCIHDGLGLTLCYRDISQTIEGNANLFALTPNDCDLTVTDFDKLAQNYANKISDKFSGQVIELLGWSMGGLLAAKVVDLLSKKVTVTKLHLIDPWIPTSKVQTRTQYQSVCEFFKLVVGDTVLNWSQYVEAYFDILRSKTVNEVELSEHFDIFWSQHAVNLPEPLNTLTATQLNKVFSMSERLKTQRNEGCVIPIIDASSDVFIWWSNERENSDIIRFSEKLSEHGKSLQQRNINCSHQDIVNHPDVLNLLNAK